MKKTVQIIGIITFFILVSYALTYPYELAYKGTEDIKLIEESYEYTSLKEVINRPEFKDKVLFIRVGYLFESERTISYYTGNKQNKYTGNKQNKISIDDNGTKYIIHSKRNPYKYQINTLSKMKTHYKDEELEIVYLMSPPYRKANQKVDDFRNWKAFIKKYPVKGNHLLMSATLYNKMRDWKRSGKGKLIFPYNLIIGKKGEVLEDNAPSPIFEKEKLYTEMDSILKQ